jgi:hypothetical protein
MKPIKCLALAVILLCACTPAKLPTLPVSIQTLTSVATSTQSPSQTFSPKPTQAVIQTSTTASTPTQTASAYCKQILVNYQPADGFQTYCDSNYGFAIDYPNNWIKHIGSQSPDIASLPSAVRRVMIFEVDDMSNFIRTNTYHIYGSLTLQERVEYSLGYNDRAFPDKSYPSLVLGGHKAYVMMECGNQVYSSVKIYFQHGQYYTIMELMAINRIGLDTNWQIARSLQTPGSPPDKNVIPQELTDDSYQLLDCHTPPTAQPSAESTMSDNMMEEHVSMLGGSINELTTRPYRE